MPFPLDQGVCRVVCRPNRSKPRRVKIPAVVRFANAAVRDGEDPCDVVRAVVDELGCGPCEGLEMDVVEALDVVIEVRERLRDAVVNLLLAFGIEPEETQQKDTFLDKLIRRLRGLINIIDLANALIELVAAAADAVDLLGGVAEVLAEVSNCIGDEPRN